MNNDPSSKSQDRGDWVSGAMSADAFHPLVGFDALSEYISKYRRDGLPDLRVSRIFDLFPMKHVSEGIAPKATEFNKWPLGDDAGVYLIYSHSGSLLYVGKASMKRVLGQRLGDHFGNGAECIPREDWSQEPRFLINIAVPGNMPFEAAALEEYLIKGLKPLLNSVGK
jgi:hypothetical protein